MNSAETLPRTFTKAVAGPGRSPDDVTLAATADPNGYPRFAMLSRSELHVGDERRLLLAMWAHSRSTANLRRTGIVTLFRADDGTPVSVRLRCAETREYALSDGTLLAVFCATVESVQYDSVDYADVTSTLRFRVRDPVQMASRWAELEQGLEEIWNQIR